MNPKSAQNLPLFVLITGVSSYLGTNLAQSLLSENCHVWGISKKAVSDDLLSKKDFTLLDIDLAQPLPTHLPKFDLVFHLVSDAKNSNFLTKNQLPPAFSNILSLAKHPGPKVNICALLRYGQNLPQILFDGKSLFSNVKLFLVGDLYGPAMSLSAATTNEDNPLANLICQAVLESKVILEREGLRVIYPTFITDAIFAINKFVFSDDSKDTQIITSDEPRAALSAAYEIQNIAQVLLNKSIGLYFTSEESLVKENEDSLKINSLNFTPKVHFADGLKETFEDFKNRKLVSYGQSAGEARVNETTQEFTRRLKFDKESHLSSEVRSPATGSPRLTLKIPQVSINFNRKFRTIIILALLFFVLAFGKLAFDIYQGMNGSQKAKEAILSANFASAQKRASDAQKSLRSASKEFKILFWPAKFILKSEYQNVYSLLLSGENSAQALVYFSHGAEELAKNLALVVSKETNSSGFNTESSSANFQKAFFQTQKALEIATLHKESKLFKSKIDSLIQNLNTFSNLSQSAYELNNLLPEIVGVRGQKSYLVLLQNNAELRPGGGFIGNFALVEFESGHLKNITVEDIYTIDGQLREKIEPPRQLSEKLGVSQFYLRDSNWSPDFELNSATARDLFKKETGQDVDGIMAVDLTFVASFLEKIGPLQLDDYKEQISSANLFEKGEYYSEIGSFPGSTQKRDFFGALTRVLVNRIIADAKNNQGSQNQKSQNTLVALLETVREGLSAKHLMLTFDSPALTSFVKTKGWSRPMPPVNFDPTNDNTETRDFIAFSEANLGANKVNRFLERKVEYDMTIGRDADLVGTLKITYTNKSQADTWPQGKYVNFLRVYLPREASLFEYQNGQDTDLDSVEVTVGDKLTTFATFVEVPVKENREVIFKYRIPKNIQLEKAPTYHLYVSKQPGTHKDPFMFTFNLPNYLQAKAVNSQNLEKPVENLIFDTDLATDREFAIELIRK